MGIRLVSPEDEEFFTQYDDTTPQPTAEGVRWIRVNAELVPFVEQVKQELMLASTASSMLLRLGISGLPATAAQTEELRAHEMQVRQALEKAGYLYQLGLGDFFQDLIDKAWALLAHIIQSQREPARQPEVQKIHMALLSKQLAAQHGPYHAESIGLMMNIATSLNFQGQNVLGTRIQKMAYILLKDGEKKGEGQAINDWRPIIEALRVEIINNLTIGCKNQEAAEPYLREQAAVCESAAQEQGAAAPKAARIEFYHFPMRLGQCLTAQSKLLEAEEVLDRVLALSNELEGFKPFDQAFEELQGISVKSLKVKFGEAGMAFPSGEKDKVELIKLYIQESFSKVLFENLILMDIRGSLAKCLLRQKENHPEKLPRAELLLRQVFNALMRHPRAYELRMTLETMDDLCEALAGQHKYVEALTIGKKVCSTCKRLLEDVNSPDCKRSLEKQHEKLRLQSAFRTAAEEVLGPRHTWLTEEDGRPAQIMFEKTIQDASERRAKAGSSSAGSTGKSSSSEVEAAHYAPITYDPNDITEVNWAAMLAGLGVTGVNERPILKGGRELPGAGLSFRLLGKQVINDKDKEECWCWAATLALVQSHLSLPSGPDGTAAGAKRHMLDEALSLHSGALTEAAMEAGQHLAAGSKEVQRQREEEVEKERDGAAGSGAAQQQGGLLLKRSKPKRVCIACGAYGARKRCSRCNQAYACNDACFVAAWKAFHKFSCACAPQK